MRGHLITAMCCAVLFSAGRADALVVVCTTPDLADLAATVAGERAEVVSLITSGTQDPHTVDPQPGLIAELNRADVLIYNGLELEIGWLPGLVSAAANPNIRPGASGHFNASAAVEDLLEAGQSVSRDQGDVHPLGNPHYLLDPRNGRRVVRVLTGKLIELDPDGADYYRDRLRTFLIDFDGRIAGWEERLAGLPSRTFISYHRTWSYLAAWAGLSFPDQVEAYPGIPPSPAHLARLFEQYRGQVGALIAAPWASEHTAGQCADELGVPLVVLPVQPGGVPDSGSYADMFEAIVARLEDALQS